MNCQLLEQESSPRTTSSTQQLIAPQANGVPEDESRVDDDSIADGESAGERLSRGQVRLEDPRIERAGDGIHDSNAFTERPTDNVDPSQALADLMLEGWTLMAESCPM